MKSCLRVCEGVAVSRPSVVRSPPSLALSSPPSAYQKSTRAADIALQRSSYSCHHQDHWFRQFSPGHCCSFLRSVLSNVDHQSIFTVSRGDLKSSVHLSKVLAVVPRICSLTVLFGSDCWINEQRLSQAKGLEKANEGEFSGCYHIAQKNCSRSLEFISLALIVLCDRAVCGTFALMCLFSSSKRNLVQWFFSDLQFPVS